MDKKIIPQNYGTLGKEIKISPKSNVAIFVESKEEPAHIEVMINIGESHSAILKMNTSAWIALREGDPVTVMTTKNFKKNLIK